MKQPWPLVPMDPPERFRDTGEIEVCADNQPAFRANVCATQTCAGPRSGRSRTLARDAGFDCIGDTSVSFDA